MPGASDLSSGATLTGVTLDSRQVRPGDLYVGLPGQRTHGARHAASAAAAGALAVLTDAEGAQLAADAGIPVAVVEDPRVAMAHLAADVYGHPTGALDLFGVTGTNGKTSTAFLLDAALVALGRTVATIGTIGYRLAGAELPGTRTTITTPESPDLQALLAVLAERGADTVAMEVSSHALALHRVEGIRFDAAAFTMLGQDHLEFHHTLEEYFAAKAQLFTPEHTARAVVNTAD
ncbi:MAG: Mur ligase family protein, partial [Propionibacteriaceae bacterium]|nr:Mur ligase family protein [Propionibacteriaceae bacterium]